MAVLVVVALSLPIEPAAAQKSGVERGAGEGAVRTADKKRDGVVRDRGRNADAARGRTSGRVDRSSRRGDDVVPRRNGRVERTRTSRREQERVITRRRQDERREKAIILDRREGYDSRERNSRGPKFCQDGSGHPVHGMAWCYEKGFGGTNERRILTRRDRDLDDVVIIDRDRRNRTSRSGTVLDEILGDMRRGPLFDYLWSER